MGDIPNTWATSEFKTGDGYTLKVRRYPATGVVKGEIVCLHGIQSHAGWYEFSCTYLSQRGYNVSFIDRREIGRAHV